MSKQLERATAGATKSSEMKNDKNRRAMDRWRPFWPQPERLAGLATASYRFLWTLLTEINGTGRFKRLL